MVRNLQYSSRELIFILNQLFFCLFFDIPGQQNLMFPVTDADNTGAVIFAHLIFFIRP